MNGPSRHGRRPVAGARMPYRKEDTIGFLLWDTERLHRRLFQQHIARHGIAWGNVPVLRELWEHDGLAVGELAARTHMSVPTTVASIRTLEAADRVRRAPNADDLRKVNVFLTDAGRALSKVLAPEVRAVNAIADAGFDPAETEQLKALLRQMRANLGRHIT